MKRRTVSLDITNAAIVPFFSLKHTMPNHYTRRYYDTQNQIVGYLRQWLRAKAIGPSNVVNIEFWKFRIFNAWKQLERIELKMEKRTHIPRKFEAKELVYKCP